MDETLDHDFEPITTHVSVPCTKSMADWYKELGQKLEKLGKKKVLTKMSRNALDGVFTQIEQAIEAELSKGA